MVMSPKLVALLLPLLLAGCASVVPEAAGVTRDRTIIANNIDAARDGDPDAQYRVGDAYCCAVDAGAGLYDTPLAVDWLCRAARQGQGRAAYRLAEIYSGDAASGVRLLPRIARGIAGGGTDWAVAYAWYRRAEFLGAEGARTAGSELWGELDADERSRAEAYVLGWTPLPCTWDEVFGGR